MLTERLGGTRDNTGQGLRLEVERAGAWSRPRRPIVLTADELWFALSRAGAGGCVSAACTSDDAGQGTWASRVDDRQAPRRRIEEERELGEDDPDAQSRYRVLSPCPCGQAHRAGTSQRHQRGSRGAEAKGRTTATRDKSPDGSGDLIGLSRASSADRQGDARHRGAQGLVSDWRRFESAFESFSSDQLSVDLSLNARDLIAATERKRRALGRS
jgi:hypothetical protein